MDITHYFAIVRRRLPLVVALPLAVALLSLVVALAQKPVYSATARVLAHRAAALTAPPADPSAKIADTVTDDLPAVIRSAGLARDVAAELARRGRTLDPDDVQDGLNAEVGDRIVLLGATAEQPEDAQALLQTAIELLQTNGLRYWGVTDLPPGQSGITLAVLETSPTAVRVNGARSIALAVGLRTLAALVAAVALAFLLHFAEALRAGQPAAAPSGERPPRRNAS